jgi:hypothetical protein
VQEGIMVMPEEDWACYCHYITNTENPYSEKDAIMVDIKNSFIINRGDMVAMVTVTVVVILKM